MDKISEIKLVDPTTETKEEICFHNLKVADRYYQLNLFIASSFGWFRLHPDKNYQDFEEFLRANQMNTHLIAANPTIDKTLYSLSGEPAEFEALFSCRPPSIALKELLTHSSSYEENFAKLLKAGTLKLKSTDEKIENVEMFSEKEMDDTSLLINLKKKILIQEIPIADYFNMIRSTNKDIKNVIVGLAKGNPVFGLLLNDKLVVNIGYFIQDDKMHGVYL